MYFSQDGTNKLNRGEKNVYDNLSSFKYLKYGEVVSITDEFGLGRIKVRIKGSQTAGGDDGVPNDKLPYATPMIPKFLSTYPKIGEAVWVFVFDKSRQHNDRLFIGPIISQLNKLNKDNALTTAFAGFSFGPVGPSVNVNTIPELKGVFPDLEDVSIQGRYNTDITQKNNEIILRAGKFETVPSSTTNPFPFQFNAKTQAYIQIKNDVVLNNNEGKGTVTNIVANKINLLTHNEGNPRFNLTGQDMLISDSELSRILDEAHQVPFGDVVLEYLILLKEALFAHVHNGNGNTATDLTSSGNKQPLKVFESRAKDLEKSMLSKNIRIN